MTFYYKNSTLAEKDAESARRWNAAGIGLSYSGLILCLVIQNWSFVVFNAGLLIWQIMWRRDYK